MSSPSPDPRRAQEIEAEQRLIGAVLQQADTDTGSPETVIEQASALLDVESFAQPPHRMLWRAILTVHSKGLRPESMRVIDALIDAGDLQKLPGAATYLATCIEAAAVIQSVPYYAKKVLNAATMRSLSMYAEQLVKVAQEHDPEVRTAQVLEIKEHLGNGLSTGLVEQKPTGFGATLYSRSRLVSLPPIEPLITDVMSKHAAVLLVGPTGVGKTFVALSWACSVGTGHDWLGHEVEQSPVLYVVGEGASGLNTRVAAWEQAWQTSVPDDAVTFSIKPATLSRHQTWVEMTQVATDLGAKFVVLDTFSSLAPDADETKDAAQITRWLSNMAADIGGTALLVHHPGWGDAERSRGGYQLEANVDEVLLLRGNSRDPQIAMERKKVKDGPSGAQTWLERKSMFDSVIVEQISAADAQVPMRERILHLLGGTLDGVTGPQICTELGADTARTTVYRPLKDLVKDGLVIGEGPRGRQRYSLASDTVPSGPEDM